MRKIISRFVISVAIIRVAQISDLGISQPYKVGDLLYDIKALTEDYMGFPGGLIQRLTFLAEYFRMSPIWT